MNLTISNGMEADTKNKVDTARKIALLILAILLHITPVWTQDTLHFQSTNESIGENGAQLPEGALRTDNGVLKATFEMVVGDSLWIVENGWHHAVPINTIHTIKIYTDETSSALGASIGVLVGGIAGGFIGNATYEEPPPPSSGVFRIQIKGPERFGRIAAGAFIGSGIGGLIGALIGYANRGGNEYDLRFLSLPEKVKLIASLLAKKQQGE